MVDSTLFSDALNNGLETMFQKIQAELPKIAAESISALQQQVNDLNATVKDHEARIEALESTPGLQSANNITEVIHREIADINRRSRNLILYDFAERENQTADTSAIKEILTTVDMSAALRSAYRLGKPRDNGHRPLKLILNTEAEA